MSVKVFSQPDVLLDSVPAAWWTPIATDWFGKPVESAPEYAIGLSSEHLLFAGRRSAPPVTIPEARLGECIEGLWKYDAAELFVRNGAGPQYFEINLGPQSAWWMGVFSEYRQADLLFPSSVMETIKPVLTWSDIREESWAAGVIFTRQSLPFSLQDNSLFVNPTFCLSKPEPTFLTAQKLPSDKPDFHRLGELVAAKAY